VLDYETSRSAGTSKGAHPFIFAKGTHPSTNMKGCVPFDVLQRNIAPVG
jgi:hypothetical protein